jgi:hypothetical protein
MKKFILMTLFILLFFPAIAFSAMSDEKFVELCAYGTFEEITMRGGA